MNKMKMAFEKKGYKEMELYIDVIYDEKQFKNNNSFL
jgi:hypothetical protein